MGQCYEMTWAIEVQQCFKDFHVFCASAFGRDLSLVCDLWVTAVADGLKYHL